MHMTSFIASVVAFAVVGLFIGWVLKAGSRNAQREKGRAVIYYPAPVKIGHFIGTAILVWLVVRAALAGETMYVMSFGTMAFVISCFSVELYTKRIEFDDQEILIYFAWLQPKRIPWADVVSLKPQSEWDLILKTRTRGKITLLTFLSGLRDLRAAATKNIKQDVPPVL